MSYPPSWFTPSPATARQNLAVARGLHPMGMPLLGGGASCGGCAHLFKSHKGSAYLKCLKTRMTHGRGSDIRAKWPACSLFKEGEP